MTITPEMLASVPFRYADDVRAGRIVVGKRIKQAVERFYRWIDEVPGSKYYLDHAAGMHIINFYPLFLNHTKGKMAGKPFHLAPFQAFTMYNVFGWKKMAGDVPNRTDDKRRIKTVYDKRAKKNGKSAEMAGLALYMLSLECEMEAEVYVGATKEEQARICWNQAAQFISSPLAGWRIRHKDMGFLVQQKKVRCTKTHSFMMPLGGDSKTQDGINAHLGIIDEYHAHPDNGVKGNLASSMVQRSQPILWHITTAGTNVQSVCKRYEDSVIEVLEGRVEIDHLFVMIHDLDAGDDWEDETNWIKANPLMGDGLDIERIREEYQNTKVDPSEVPNFKTKHLNMWVDAPTVWIPSEIWAKNKHELTKDEVREKFRQFGGYMGIDLSINTDLSAVVCVSEPDDDGNRYVVPFIFCPEDTIEKRSKEDNVQYRYWADNGHIIATQGNQIDFDVVEDTAIQAFSEYNITRIEGDQYQFAQMAQNIMKEYGESSVSYYSQSILSLSAPTKAFQRLVYNGNLLHDGNPVMAWNLAGCQVIRDANENIKVHKGKSNANGRRIDSIPALINALGGSMSPAEPTNDSVYNDPRNQIFI